MKKFFKLSVCLLVLLIVALTVISPDVYLTSALFGIRLWAITVVPSLLPFFFFTALLSGLGLTKLIAKTVEKPFRAVFNTNGVIAYAFVMSILSGYPVGAKIIADLRDNQLIDEVTATKASCLCSTSGPLFIVGSVGFGMFKSKTAGYAILISHTLSAIFCGLIFRNYGKQVADNSIAVLKSQSKSQNLLYDSVYSSVISVACVGGFICIFSVIYDVAKNIGIFSPLSSLLFFIKSTELKNAFLYGLIECTRGCKSLATLGLSTYSLSFASALISFGGISVWAQSIIFLKNAGAKIKIFCLSKLIQSLIAFALCFLICLIFKVN